MIGDSSLLATVGLNSASNPTTTTAATVQTLPRTTLPVIHDPRANRPINPALYNSSTVLFPEAGNLDNDNDNHNEASFDVDDNVRSVSELDGSSGTGAGSSPSTLGAAGDESDNCFDRSRNKRKQLEQDHGTHANKRQCRRETLKDRVALLVDTAVLELEKDLEKAEKALEKATAKATEAEKALEKMSAERDAQMEKTIETVKQARLLANNKRISKLNDWKAVMQTLGDTLSKTSKTFMDMSQSFERETQVVEQEHLTENQIFDEMLRVLAAAKGR